MHKSLLELDGRMGSGPDMVATTTWPLKWLEMLSS